MTQESGNQHIEPIEWTAERSDSDIFAPPAVWEKLQQSECPIGRTRIWDGSEPWVITKYEHYRSLMSDSRLSSDKTKKGFPLKNPGYSAKGKSMVWMDDPEHRPLRRLWSQNISVKRMSQYRNEVEEIVRAAADGLIGARPPADFIRNFAFPVASNTLSAVLGIPTEMRQRLLELGAQISSVNSSLEAVTAALDEVKVHANELVVDRERNLGDDVLSNFIRHGVQQGVMSREELVDEVALQATAGHDTTVGMISLGTLALLSNPDQKALLVEHHGDEVFLSNAIEELLRYISPAHTGRRRIATADIQIDEFVIREGDGVVALDNQSSRDPEIFENPHLLDLRRPNARNHNAMGFGIHQCAGQALARMELKVVFGNLFSFLPELRLAGGYEDIRRREDKIIYGIDSMPVRY